MHQSPVESGREGHLQDASILWRTDRGGSIAKYRIQTGVPYVEARNASNTYAFHTLFTSSVRPARK